MPKERLKQARQANTDTGDFSAWSAAFVTACVRGAAITLGLEATIPPGRRHVGRDELLLATLGHAAYTADPVAELDFEVALGESGSEKFRSGTCKPTSDVSFGGAAGSPLAFTQVLDIVGTPAETALA